MGFVMRLNSRDLVNDPKNGAEVYPITATNAVYRAGTDKSLEQILTDLENQSDRNVVQSIDYTNPNLEVTYTNGNSVNIPLHINVDNKNANLTFGNTSTLATVDGQNITVTMPEAPSVNSLSRDIEVTQWGDVTDYTYWFDSTIENPVNTDSFLYAVGLSLKINPETNQRDIENGRGCLVRIHLVNNIFITSDIWLNTSNVELHGHFKNVFFAKTVNSTLEHHNLRVFGYNFIAHDTIFTYADDTVHTVTNTYPASGITVKEYLPLSTFDFMVNVNSDSSHPDRHYPPRLTILFDNCNFENFFNYKKYPTYHSVSDRTIFRMYSGFISSITPGYGGDSDIQFTGDSNNTITLYFQNAGYSMRSFILEESSDREDFENMKYNSTTFTIRQMYNLGSVNLYTVNGKGAVKVDTSEGTSKRMLYSAQCVLWDKHTNNIYVSALLLGNGGHSVALNNNYTEGTYIYSNTRQFNTNETVWYDLNHYEQQGLISQIYNT